jgi:hypothetical protein
MEAIHSSETLVRTGTTRRHSPEDDILDVLCLSLCSSRLFFICSPSISKNDYSFLKQLSVIPLQRSAVALTRHLPGTA